MCGQIKLKEPIPIRQPKLSTAGLFNSEMGNHLLRAQSAVAVEYTDCSSAEGLDSLNEGFDYPIYQPLRSGRIWHKVNF